MQAFSSLDLCLRATLDPLLVSKYSSVADYCLCQQILDRPDKRSSLLFRQKIKFSAVDARTAEICFPRLTTTVDCVTGPGVPFRGKVAAIFKEPKIKISWEFFKINSLKFISFLIKISQQKIVLQFQNRSCRCVFCKAIHTNIIKCCFLF